jgi:peroxiredoxin
MTLQDQLDVITARTRELVQADRLAVSEQAVAELFATGIEDNILPEGALAPEFALTDASTGRLVKLSDLLAVGPVVVKFFRGRWDPYCITELEVWRDLFGEVRDKGALLVAISPQTKRQNDFAVQQHGFSFPLLSDPGCTVAASYGIAHTVPLSARNYYRSILVNIPFANAGLGYDTATEASWRLPLPALYLIGQDRRILFAEAHADNRVRPEPGEVLSLL